MTHLFRIENTSSWNQYGTHICVCLYDVMPMYMLACAYMYINACVREFRQRKSRIQRQNRTEAIIHIVHTQFGLCVDFICIYYSTHPTLAQLNCIAIHHRNFGLTVFTLLCLCLFPVFGLFHLRSFFECIWLLFDIKAQKA